MSSTSTITLVDNSARLSRSEETALNILLERAGGSFQGKPWYRLTWAADDNVGLMKRHGLGCPKTDPQDWTCDCPRDPSVKVPVCFDPNQACYHLLAWSPPRQGWSAFQNEFVGEDLSRGTYECTGLHFVDPETQAPFSPKAVIIEHIIPHLKQFEEMVKATTYGVDAIVQRERQKRKDKIKAEQKAADKRQTEYFADVLNEAAPAFGGAPHTGYGSKVQIAADLNASDVKPKAKPEIHSGNFSGTTFRKR